MTAKKDYGDFFNKLLGVEVDWSKLNKEELASLATVFGNPEIILHKLGLDAELKTRVARERLLDAGTTLFRNWDGPLARAARRVFGVPEPGESREDPEKEEG